MLWGKMPIQRVRIVPDFVGNRGTAGVDFASGGDNVCVWHDSHCIGNGVGSIKGAGRNAG